MLIIQLISASEKKCLTVVVVNREHSEFSYQVKIMQGKQLLKEEKFTLNTIRKEIPLEFVADHLGQNKLEFKLYKCLTPKIFTLSYLQVNVS